MKKSVLLVVVFAFALILTLSLTSAFWPFSPSKNSVTTGNIISDGTAFSNTDLCSDSDGGIFAFVYGEVSSRGISQVDKCRGKMISERYCTSQKRGAAKDYVCANGCSDGTCLYSINNNITLYEGQMSRVKIGDNIHSISLNAISNDGLNISFDDQLINLEDG